LAVAHEDDCLLSANSGQWRYFPKADRRDLYPARFDSKRSWRYPHCRGDLKIIAAIEEPAVIVRDTHAPGLACSGQTVSKRFGPIPGSNNHREGEIFTKHRAIDRYVGRAI
jgi:hypothetical protein